MVWLAILLGLGFFAPRVLDALSGAGWVSSGSESVEVRERADDRFGGPSSYALRVVVSSAYDPTFRRTVERVGETLSDSSQMVAAARSSTRSRA